MAFYSAYLTRQAALGYTSRYLQICTITQRVCLGGQRKIEGLRGVRMGNRHTGGREKWRLREDREEQGAIKKPHYLRWEEGFLGDLTWITYKGNLHTRTPAISLWQESIRVKPQTKFNYSNGLSNSHLPCTQRSTNTVPTLKVCHGCGLDHMLSDKRQTSICTLYAFSAP